MQQARRSSPRRCSLRACSRLGVVVAVWLVLAAPAWAQEELDVSKIRLGSAPCTLQVGSGSPEGAVTGRVCDAYLRTDGTSFGTTLYLKTSGTGNTGWTAAAAGTGTVTSVALALPAQFSVSGSPVTTTGTLTGAWASQTANYILAAPNGSAGTPTFRAMVAADVPTLNQSTTGSAASLKSPSTTGLFQASGMTAGTTRVKTVRDANDTLLELGGSYTPTGTWAWTSATATWPTFNQNTTGTAANATNIGVANDTTTNATMYPVWVTATTGNLPAKASSTKLTFNPSTGVLTPAALSVTNGTTFGSHAVPGTGYTVNLGSASAKYLTLYTAELLAETLVAQDTQATVGGRVLVGETTILTSDLAAAATTMAVKHNALASGDRVRLEASGNLEWIAVASAPGGAGPYTYTITRNLDGSGANDWYAGDAVFNTGTTNDGYLDLYSGTSTMSASDYGPTVAGIVRTGTTYSDLSERWALGNLNGLFGYSATTYGAAFGSPSEAWLKIDPTNGVRLGHNTTTKVQIEPDGDATFSGQVTATTGAIGGFTLGANTLSSGTDADYVALMSGGTNAIQVGDATFADAEFSVTSAGALTATSATITGAITASSGSVTGDFQIGSGGRIRQGQTAYDTGTGFWLGDVSGTPKFSIGNASAAKLTWDGTTLATTSLTFGGTSSIPGAYWDAANVWMGTPYSDANTHLLSVGVGTMSLNNSVDMGYSVPLTAYGIFPHSAATWQLGASGQAWSKGYITEVNASDLIATDDLTVGDDVAVNTDKFTVDGTTGNTVVAGTLSAASLSLSAQPYVRVYKNASQLGFSANTWAVLTWESEDADALGWHDPVTNTSRITVGTGYGGTYLIGGNYHLDDDANQGGGYTAIMFRKNAAGSATGGTYLCEAQSYGGATKNSAKYAPSCVLPLAAADYVEVFAKVNQGASESLVVRGGTVTASHFTLTKLF